MAENNRFGGCVSSASNAVRGRCVCDVFVLTVSSMLCGLKTSVNVLPLAPHYHNLFTPVNVKPLSRHYHNLFTPVNVMPLAPHCHYTGWRKKRPEHSHGVMQQSSQNESAEKHVCNEQTSLNMSRNSRLKHLRISRDTNEIVLHVIKQCLQAVHHLCCRSYTGYTRTSQ